MNQFFISLLIAFTLAGCGHSKILPSPASPERLQSSCKILVADTIPAGIHVRVADESKEMISFSAVVILDSAGKVWAGAMTDPDGCSPAMACPEGTFDLKISYIGYIPLLVKNISMSKGQGCRIHAQLKPVEEIIDYGPCPYPEVLWMRDRFSPQNRTITREEYRRMPK